MALEDIVADMLAEGVKAEEFLDFFTGIGMGDHPYIAEVTQQLAFREIDQNPGSPVPEWTGQDAQTLLDMLSSPVLSETEFEPWSPGFQAEVLLHEDAASASIACIMDGDIR